MSICYNLGALREVPNRVIERLFVADLEIIDLERWFKAIATKIK
jgi:hypothetical protein